MRKIILWMGVSVDGFFEGPNREIGWHRIDEEFHRHANEELAKMSMVLHGRVVYELMAAFWPRADQDPAATPTVREFARIWREMPKIVFSRTLPHAEWNTTVLREVVPDQIREMKALPGGDMVVGGADLAASFMRHDLIDEFRIYVHPVVIGRGKPLFQPSEMRINLRLIESRAFGNGVVLLHYERV